MQVGYAKLIVWFCCEGTSSGIIIRAEEDIAAVSLRDMVLDTSLRGLALRDISPSDMSRTDAPDNRCWEMPR